MTTPSNKVAIVTGGAGGVGAAICERLGRDGFTVVVNYGGSVAAAEALVARIEAAGGRADRMRREMYRNIDLESLLHPAVTA